MTTTRRAVNPRTWQIAFLSAFLTYIHAQGGFTLPAPLVAVVIATALATQALLDRLVAVPTPSLRSALISALSLCLLLRADHAAVAALAALLAIGSKFVLRIRGKHVFNPTNFGILATILLGGKAWISPGQWGSGALLALATGALGIGVAHRASRLDVSLAFLAAHAALNLGRVLWLGERPEVLAHRLTSGALLVFAFFMISDPRSTPDTRPGRVLFAFLVAALGHHLQFHHFVPGAPLWALLAVSPLTPAIDRILPGRRFEWARKEPPMPLPRTAPAPARQHRLLAVAAAALTALALAAHARAFCGFYVAKADASLWNEASQVVLVRDGERTVLTMSNDYQGELDEFAIVVPVPVVLEKDQIHVGDRRLIERLDAFSAPRLVEYFDPDPCRRVYAEADAMKMTSVPAAGPAGGDLRSRSLGVTIEARYTVGEYDILILSAKESSGLETWLVENGYRLPKGAAAALAPYIRQGLKFFVARVNLEEQAKTGFSYLRPLAMAFESPRFMLPIRLGMLNARGPQDLVVYAITRQGRVETTNYRGVRVASDVDLPLHVKGEFATFYRAMFERAWEREGKNVAFLEHFWDMAWCDPCASDPLTADELRGLGVFWLDGKDAPGLAPPRPQPRPVNALLTRLHVRYDAAHFPEDLVFQETRDRTNFQGRYVLRHPYAGEATCPEARDYRRSVRERQEREAQTLASLTGWELEEIRRKVRDPWPGDGNPEATPATTPWWRRIWE